ncbi:T9SS type A sorting domain-containing protein [Prolixibacteraceae bacterium Z1-6]|uniref:T9SS type A sorting domain-containing protein n=1 Tax=Draconibacterium aestuarii TaxID=2998507 RepID=A0A9X3F8V8_9BACT|nr:T9SS type A sorting domain-containing protein [Prolixibacteraceae bacterium Z1-6]
MRNVLLGLCMALILVGNASESSAQTPIVPVDGDGTEINPYHISSLENLYWLSQNEEEWDKHYIQTADINAAATKTWDFGDHDEDPNTPDTTMGFTPIGFFGFTTIAFTGSYNGDGHTIDSLYINRLTPFAVGLFGHTNEASITRLGLTNLEVTGGSYYIGGVIGSAYKSEISYTYAKGIIKGSTSGFLVGNLEYSTIYDCYAAGTIAEGYSDGLLGSGANSLIKNSYSAVNAVNRTPCMLGGHYDLENAFYDTDLAGDNRVDTMAKVSYELKLSCTYLESGWDFMDEDVNGTGGVWGMNEKNNNGYPFLWWEGYENAANYSNCCFYPEFVIEGDGSAENPYQLENDCQLKWLSQNDSVWNKHFIQINDISLSASINWNYGNQDQDGNTALEPLGFKPIGHYFRNANQTITTVGFEGTYNGQGFMITDLYMNRPQLDHIGFFGVIKSGKVKNLGITRANITGGTATAIFAGNIQESTIEDCYSQGSVTGGTVYGGMVGGFVGGVNWDSYINRCYADCDVKSDYGDVGGFMGSGSGEISFCYALGTVSGGSSVGGFVGFQSGTIKNSYCRNSISSEANRNVGGFVGWGHTDGRAEHCYSASIVNCPDGNYVDGFVGVRTEFYMDDCLFDSTLTSMHNIHGGIQYPTDEMKDMCTYLNRHWDFFSENGNGTDDYWKINENYNDGYPFLFWQDGQHTGDCLVNSATTLTDEIKFQAYPNPAQSVITIETTTLSSKVEIIDSKGNLITTLYANGEPITVDISSFHAGLYFVREITDDAIYSQKIIKQ